MSVPTITVQVEFEAGVWTDVTQYVDLSAGITGMGRGRRDERSETSPYSATLEVFNQDGRFTPGNTSSPYYPNVTLGKRVRVSVTAGATSSDRFTGHVTEWPVEFPGGGISNARVTFIDRLGARDARASLRSVPEEAILSYGPGAFWPLGDPEESTAAGEISGNGQPGLEVRQYGSGGKLTFGNATGVPFDGISSPTFEPVDSNNGLFLAADLAKAVGDGARVGAACTFNIAAAPSEPAVLVELNDLSSSWRWQIYVGTDGKLYQKEYWPDTGGFYESSLSTPVVTDGSSHALTVVETVGASVNSVSLRLDGTHFESYSRTKHDLWPIARVFIGGDPWGGDLFTGSIGHVAVFGAGTAWGSDLSSHMRYGLDGHAVGDAITDLRTWGGIDVGDVVLPPPGFDLDVYGTGIAHRPTEGKSPAGVLLAIARDEGGNLFVDGSGRYVFQERSYRWESVPVLEIGSENLAGPALSLTYNDQGLVNDVTASLPNGGHDQRVVNTDSEAIYGAATGNLELALPTERELLERAGWEVNIRAEAYPRVSDLALDLLTMDQALTEAVLGLDVGDQVLVVTMPEQAADAALSLDLEGWTESLSLTSWTLKLNTSRPVAGLLLLLDDVSTGLDYGYLTGY